MRSLKTAAKETSSQQLSVKYGDLYVWLSSGITYGGRRLGTIFFLVLGGLFHRKAALTFLLRADLQQWSVNYGDLYVGLLNGNPFSVRYEYKHYTS